MTDGEWHVLIEVGDAGQRLRVLLGDLYAPAAADLAAREWRHARIEVDAFPFTGVIQTVLTAEDIRDYANRASDFEASGGSVCTLGGDRAAEIRLARAGDVLEVTVTPSGDDPFPTLSYLIFRDPELVVTPPVLQT